MAKRVEAAQPKRDFNFNYTAEPTPARFHQSNAFIRGIRGPYGCLAADHEVLTRTGWVRMDAWAGEEILVVDLKEGRSWFEACEFVDLPCDEFLHFKSRGLDMVCSHEHRIPYVKKYNRGVLRVASAQEIAAEHERLKSGWDGLVPCAYPAPENARGVALSDAELRVMVMVCADGSFSDRTSTKRCSVGVRKDRKKTCLLYTSDAADE